MMDPKNMPFDAKRMIYGGFKVIVDLDRLLATAVRGVGDPR